MELLNTQEKAHLQRILARSSQLQTADDRRNFLTLCDLIEYCDVQLDKTSSKFVIGLLAQLSKVYIKAENSKRLGLVVFLENISNFDLDLSEEDKKFIQYVITKCETGQVNKPGSVPSFEPINSGQLTRQEYLNRQALLNKVRNFWIKGVLERSLYNQARIELGLEDRLDALDLIWITPEHPRLPLPRGTKIISKFDELGVGARTLLILGAPGSGKTTTLLELTHDLIERAEQEIHQPIPVIFNLSSWAGEKQEITDWLVQELKTKYHESSKSLCQTWIEKQQLLLLLDGLDEVRAEQREECVKAINQFSQEHGQTEIVVTSRIQDYEDLSSRLQFQAAIFIQPLTPEQIDDYLNQASDRLAGVKLALQTDTAIQELARTPLMLSVMALAYEGLEPAELPQMSLEERRKHLWDRYIERMFERRRGDRRYPKERAINWLVFLAQKMVQESQTLFLIEQICPNWLLTKAQKWIYRIGTALICGLMIEWAYGLTIGLIVGLLRVHMLVGLLVGIILGFVGSLGAEITLFQAPGWSWSWQKAWKPAITGFFSGPTIGLLIWLLGLAQISLQAVLEISLLTGLLIAILISFFSGFVARNKEKNTLPNTNYGIWQSAKNSGIYTLSTLILIVLPTAVIADKFVPLSALLGCVSLYAGGLACVQHLTVRTILWQIRKVPWNYYHFLNYASEHLLLQKVGGGYQFTHEFLRKNLLNSDRYQELKLKKYGFIWKLKQRLILAFVITLIILLSSITVPLVVDSWRVESDLEQALIPRLKKHDCLLIDRISYHFSELDRGDIISFKPTQEMKQKGFNYNQDVKQVIGLPGERVEINDGQVYINGKSMKSIQKSHFVVHQDFINFTPVIVPKSTYLVAVNNPKYRDRKSNFTIGLIPQENITGRVVFRFWPLHQTKIEW